MERAVSSDMSESSKRILLLISGIAWLTAGILIISKGVYFITENSHHILFHLLIGVTGGVILYLIYFNKIPGRSVKQIRNSGSKGLIIFLFAIIKKYFLTALIIAILFYFKQVHYFTRLNLSIADICIGLPVLLASLKFFYPVIFINRILRARKNQT